MRTSFSLGLLTAVLSQDPRGCNPLTNPGISCLLPFPSDFFHSKTWDPTAPPSLTLSNTSMPDDTAAIPIDPVAGGYNSAEGFSPLGPILSYIPGLDILGSSLPPLWNIPFSVTPGCNSVLLRVSDGKPQLHWVELDHSGDDSGTQLYERTLLAWPAARLADGEEYIVAFRNLTDGEGMRITPSDGFSALLTGAPTANPALEALRPSYVAIFAALEGAGWSKSSLTLAWKFTTNTQANMTARFLHMRDDAFARIAAGGGVKYHITGSTESPAANTSRRIHGSFSVPCYLPYNAIPALDSKLNLDPATGLPTFFNMVDFDFEVVIPNSVAAGGKPAKVLQYGHGLFGDHGEVEENYLATFGEEHGYVLAATDWIGLSEYDEATVVVMIAGGGGGFSDFRIVPDRLHQGMLNALVLMKLITQSAFTRDPLVTYGGASVISTLPSDWHYTGNSQGGIMGSVYMAASTDVVRGLVGVGGGPYALLLPRSSDFSALFDLLKIRYPRSMDRMGILAIMQLLWDRMDPAGWAGYVSGTPPPLPGTPSHRVVHHYGLGDHQVTWLGAHAIAASMGAVMFESNVVEGNETLAGYFPFVKDTDVVTEGNVIVGFDFGFPVNPFDNNPPSSGPVSYFLSFFLSKPYQTLLGVACVFVCVFVLLSHCSHPPTAPLLTQIRMHTSAPGGPPLDRP